jgi:hypothetical protein
MAKILQSNGVFVCKSPLQHLTDEELDSSVHKDMRHNFDESIEHHLGLAALPQDFPAEDLTSDPTYYDDTNVMDPEYGDAEVTPEKGDNYLSAELMLPKGGVMVKGRVTARKHNWMATLLGVPMTTQSLTPDHTSSILMMVTRLNSLPI